VGDVLGIPSSGRPVPTSDKKMLPRDVLEFNNISIPSLERHITAGRLGDHFRRSFILYALTVLLCPTSRYGPTSKHLASVVDVSNPRDYNWAQYVLDWLCEGIQSFQVHGEKKNSIGGCVYFLMVRYALIIIWIKNLMIIRHRLMLLLIVCY